MKWNKLYQLSIKKPWLSAIITALVMGVLMFVLFMVLPTGLTKNAVMEAKMVLIFMPLLFLMLWPCFSQWKRQEAWEIAVKENTEAWERLNSELERYVENIEDEKPEFEVEEDTGE
jgi:hypothetical protein